MLTLFISPQQELLRNGTSKGMANPLLVVRGEEILRFHDCKGLGRVEDIELFVASRHNPPHVRPIKLFAGLREAVIQVVHRYHDEEDATFDRYAFVCLAYGIDWSERAKNCLKLWDLRRQRSRQKIGQVVFLTGEDWRDFHHAAIYIGCGLYISMYGAGGQLEVASLEGMMEFYNSRKVFFAVPRG